jgi:YHS domain-containing protein
MGRLILWAILIFFILRSVSRLLHGVLEGAGYRRDVPEGKNSVALVKDPVCGVFVVPGQALTSGSGTAAKYFCSEKCRREWRDRR